LPIVPPATAYAHAAWAASLARIREECRLSCEPRGTVTRVGAFVTAAAVRESLVRPGESGVGR
jgi:hypothetical protein